MTDLNKNKEFYILFREKSKIKELIKIIKKVFIDIEQNYVNNNQNKSCFKC
ncbi:MAG: hypothetical protein Q9M97_03715 [Candidatus Gracilibacteria bacterium]|nr:hypothetical protein [Candidatus Gracilibacteria bacterium]